MRVVHGTSLRKMRKSASALGSMPAKPLEYLSEVHEPTVVFAPSINIVEVAPSNAPEPSPNISSLSSSISDLPEPWGTDVQVTQGFFQFMQSIDGGSKKHANAKQYMHSAAQMINHVGGYDKLDIDCARPYVEILRKAASAKVESNVQSKSLSGLTVRAYLYNLDHFCTYVINRCPVKSIVANYRPLQLILKCWRNSMLDVCKVQNSNRRILEMGTLPTHEDFAKYNEGLYASEAINILNSVLITYTSMGLF